MRDLWAYRELLYFLGWRDLKVRYKQTVLGVAWAVLQPVLSTVVIVLVFGRVMRQSLNGLPYPVFVICALVAWQLFGHTLTESSNSLLLNQRLVTKVYFPRIIIPLSCAFVGIVDAALALIVAVVVNSVFGLSIGPKVLLAPVVVLFTASIALGIGLWLSALNVLYRDVKYVVPFTLQLWFFLTPVVYPVEAIPDRLRGLYSINPMVGAIELMRWALVGANFPWFSAAVSALLAVIILASGIRFFQRTERLLADVI